MNSLRRRSNELVRRFGEPFASQGMLRKGIFTRLAWEDVEALLSSQEQAVARRPVEMAYVLASDPAQASDHIDRSGEEYQVLRVLEARFRGETIAKMLVLG